MLFSLFREGGVANFNEPLWEIVPVVFGVWLFFFIAKYVAAYALWFKPYASRVRAVSLSFCAILIVYLTLIGGVILIKAFTGTVFDFVNFAITFWEFHLKIYALPYLAAVAVGWLFARPAPDVRESF